MEPIVSPWFIYFLGIAETIRGFFIGFTAAAWIAFVICIIGWVVCKHDSGGYADNFKIWKKWLPKTIILTLFFSVITMCFPSKNTMITMYVADNITPNNVEKALEVGADFKNEIKKDIIELIEAIQKGEDESGD